MIEFDARTLPPLGMSSERFVRDSRQKRPPCGYGITAVSLRHFVETFDSPDADKCRLLDLTPSGYTGLAKIWQHASILRAP